MHSPGFTGEKGHVASEIVNSESTVRVGSNAELN